MEEKNLTLEQENVIKEKAKKLKTEGKYRKVFPRVVFGDTESGEKEFYVAYMSIQEGRGTSHEDFGKGLFLGR